LRGTKISGWSSSNLVAVSCFDRLHAEQLRRNTGHDFIGKSTGRGALSVWTHHLKGFELLDSYSIGEYRGPAARIGAALETWEAANAMVATNATVVVPIDQTVGYGGGWQLGGGHGPLTSYRGLGADQILSLNVVTADGRFVTADLNQNSDLFFALRGGGGSKQPPFLCRKSGSAGRCLVPVVSRS